jgi:hypothetical protein
MIVNPTLNGCMCLSKDKKLLYVNNINSSVIVCDIYTGKHILIMSYIRNTSNNHIRLSTTSTILGKDNDIICRYNDGTIMIWGPNGDQKKSFITNETDENDYRNSILFSETTSLIYVSGKNTIKAFTYDGKLSTNFDIGSPLYESGSLTWLKKDYILLVSSESGVLWVNVVTKESQLMFDPSENDYKVFVSDISVSHNQRKVICSLILKPNVPSTLSSYSSRISIFKVPDPIHTKILYPKNVDMDDDDIKFSISPDGNLFSITSVSFTPFLRGQDTVIETYEMGMLNSLVHDVVYKGILFQRPSKESVTDLLLDGRIESANEETEIITIKAESVANLQPGSNFSIETKSELGTDKVTFTAKDHQSASSWVEAINALVYNMALQDNAENDETKIISQYRFDQLQYMYQNNKIFGLQIPKTIIESIGNYVYL